MKNENSRLTKSKFSLEYLQTLPIPPPSAPPPSLPPPLSSTHCLPSPKKGCYIYFFLNQKKLIWNFGKKWFLFHGESIRYSMFGTDDVLLESRGMISRINIKSLPFFVLQNIVFFWFCQKKKIPSEVSLSNLAPQLFHTFYTIL